ncbi:uncharacterized protein LOC125124398 [Phacochoerus africanus]|uniref:uncharacterized protein LOC125124398 n=1 Tax=Phacochoerus africanus TaxID=41426 RepID=UPI001FD87C0A|nr:uncharacterized protein LOC125124398 [Phacochoerus africanus]
MPLSAALKSLFITYVLTTLVFGSVESYQCVSCSLHTCSADTQTTCGNSQSCFSHREELKTSGELYNLLRRKAVLQAHVSHWTYQHHWGITKHLDISISAAKMNCVTRGNSNCLRSPLIPMALNVLPATV